ncbi:TIGR03083 family protein [Streptomyces sp. DvalAA-14]|nr:TIGR03083 family protein [Streptomyces sp. DvalAA-14]
MSGPVFPDGGDGRAGNEDSRPQVPRQRDRTGTPDGPGYGPGPSDAGPSASSTSSASSSGSAKPPRPPQSSQPSQPPPYDHGTLKSLLGAWALSVCTRDEAVAVETHLTDCAGCADEAVRLRDAVGLLHQEESLDLDPLLRVRVLEGCLGRRPARIPVPEWAGPYDAETARLDALLRDLGGSYWKAPVELRWFDGAPVRRQLTVGEVIAHLTAVDSLVSRALDLPAPGAEVAPRSGRPDLLPLDPWERTAAHWTAHRDLSGAALRTQWREQSHNLVRTVSFAGRGAAGLDVDYGAFALPLRDAFLDRAFECWMHAWDIAEAVDYPYEPPAPRDLNRMVDLAARMLPGALADRRRAGLAISPAKLVAAGSPGRSLRLEIEGDGGGIWYLPLDSPGAAASEKEMVAQVAMDSVEFCQLAAGHIEPERIALGQMGDRAVIRDVVFATASLSRI